MSLDKVLPMSLSFQIKYAGRKKDDMGGVADGEESLDCHFDHET